jgi:hypothetical protein
MTTPSAASPLALLAKFLRAVLPGRAAQRAWDHLEPGFIARGYLPDADGWKGFYALCRMWGLYRDVERLARGGPQSRRVQSAVADARVRMRARAAEWYLLPVARVPLAQVNARGEDIELKRLFTSRRPGSRARPRSRATAGSTNEPSREQALSRGGDRPFSTTRRRRR